MPNYRSTPFLITFFMCLLLWVLLTSSLSFEELFTGSILSLIVSWISAPKLKLLSDLKVGLLFPLAIIRYLAYFLLALVKANIQLAILILSPKIQIKPQIVEIKTTMNSNLGKLLLANSITLTPGTLSVDFIVNKDNEERLLVHWINCPFPDDSEIDLRTRAVVDKFEHYLKGFVR